LGVFVASRNRFLTSSTMLFGSVGAVFLSVTHAQADNVWDKALASYARGGTSLPAVDGLNGKVDGFYGQLTKKSFYGTKGAFAIPLTGAYGMQIDGALGKFDHRSFGAVAAHLFWRNPAVGLFGIYASYADVKTAVGHVHISQVGPEFAWYWNRFTVEAVLGVEFGTRATGVVGSFIQTVDIKTRFFDKINFAYYFHDNVKTFVGHRYIGGKHAAALGLEFGTPIPRTTAMATAFVEGRLGEYTGIWGGLKLYVGKSDKTLMRRHREDDPIEWQPEGAAAGASNSGTSTPATTPTTPAGEGGD
jgi:hypothetical protein